MAIKTSEELLKMAARQKVRDLLEGKVDLEALDHLDADHPN